MAVPELPSVGIQEYLSFRRYKKQQGIAELWSTGLARACVVFCIRQDGEP